MTFNQEEPGQGREAQPLSASDEALPWELTSRPAPPGQGETRTSTPAPQPRSTRDRADVALTVAILWLIATVIIGLIFIFGAKNITFGGDAFTELQNAMVNAVRLLAFLLMGSRIGLLAIVLEMRVKR
jgi:hypothetical protein